MNNDWLEFEGLVENLTFRNKRDYRAYLVRLIKATPLGASFNDFYDQFYGPLEHTTARRYSYLFLLIRLTINYDTLNAFKYNLISIENAKHECILKVYAKGVKYTYDTTIEELERMCA